MPILTAEERLGTLLAERYRLEAIVGRGGAGVLFRAVHRWTGRQVAIKMLHEGREGELSRATRLLAEARAAAELKHPNVVEVLDADLVDGVPFVVMELLSGQSLREEWTMQGAILAEQVLRWMLPIIGAVETAHQRGILHRDIKLDNIYLANEGAGEVVPKLLDFGLARPVDRDAFVTDSGAIVGTPAFMAPEQAQGDRNLGPGVDVWALGVVLFALLSGRLPFEGDSPTAVLVKLVTEAAPRLAEIAPRVPPTLAAAVDRALQRDLNVRYQSARQFAFALCVAARKDGVALPTQPDPIGFPQWSRWLSDEPGLAGNTDSVTSLGLSRTAPQRRGARRIWPLAALGGFALVASATVAFWPRSPSSSESPVPAASPRAPLAAEVVPPAASPLPPPSAPPPPAASSSSTPTVRPTHALGPSPRVSLPRPSAAPSAKRANPMEIDPNYE